MFQEEGKPEKPQTKVNSQPPPAAPSGAQSSSWFSWGSAPSPQAQQAQQLPPDLAPRSRGRSPESIAISESQLPTTMSCRDAFDYAWHCHTPGSQWNAVYRYGSIRSCSELWDDFWFCMRTKSYPPEAKAEVIREHYRAKEKAKYDGGSPSSEDIWESRKELVPPGTAFQTKFALQRDDAESQKVDTEVRRKIIEQAESNSRK